MSEPVILLGFDRQTGHVKSVGLHPSEEYSRECVAMGRVPRELRWVLYTPRLGETLPLGVVETFQIEPASA